MAAAPPLLSLKNVSLGFGAPPLLADVELTVGEGERLALVGRNGSGKSTLLKIVAGLVEPDRGERVLRQGTTVRYLPQEPDLSGFSTTLAYVEAGLAPGDDLYRAQYLLSELGLAGTEEPAEPLRRRGAAGGSRARSRAAARRAHPRRADQPSRPAGHRMAGGGAHAHPLGHRAGQPRPPLPHHALALHPLARSRNPAADRSRLRRVRGLARRGVRARGARPPETRQKNRRRAGLDALRRDGAPQAQHGPLPRAAGAAPRAARAKTHRRRGEIHGDRRGSLRQAGHRGQKRLEGAWRKDADPRSLAAHRARRPARHRRAERRRQDDAARPAHRRRRAG